jgi:2-polyprenyl-3-methyl-5-hydroxy-6-metoxy-1,4-benzoquinol methylase
MVDLSERAELSELMDGPCSYEELRDCLRDIAKVNWLTGAYRPTIQWLDRVADSTSISRALRILDVGCGYGDMLRQIERWAATRGIAVELIGVDLNEDAVRAAREASAGSGIEWIHGDAYSCAVEADVVISSLLTHHLAEAEIVQFLAWMESSARLGWFVNDLHRQAVPYYFFRTVAPLMGWHRFVRNDGPVSIRRSFVPEDWRRMLADAGVGGVEIVEYRPARLCVGRLKDGLPFKDAGR